MTLDPSKILKKFEKIDISVGLSEPDNWLSTGIYALNYHLTGSFQHGVPNKRSFLLWGESGTGKSMFLNLLAKDAQEKGYFVFYIDTETALHKKYLDKSGLDYSSDKMMVVNIATIEELNSTISAIYQEYDDDTKICVVVDSLSNLMTDKEEENFDKGDMKADQGLLAKRLKLFMKNMNSKIGKRDMFFLASAHAYQNQDIRNGEGKWIMSGGKGFQFIPSISVRLDKGKLRDDDRETVGIVAKAEVTKTRFNKLGGRVDMEVYWESGIDQYEGLLDELERAEIVTKKGSWYSYDLDGEVKKFQKNGFGDHVNNLIDLSGDIPEETEADITEDSV